MNKPASKAAKGISAEGWKSRLTPEQYHILREKGTEAPYTGKFYASKEKGMYACAACGNLLFSSGSKFESGTGWPSFDSPVWDSSIEAKKDFSHGMLRAEVVCKKCGGHLGHVFDDGPSKTGKRFCINSCALDFKKK